MADIYNSLTRPTDFLTGTRDPLTTDDTTQGWAVGSLWFNITNLRLWRCMSNATGAAKWAFEGADYVDGGVNPAGEQTQFGGSALGSIFGAFAEEGNLYRNCANPIKGNGTDTTDDILDGFVLPAGAFDIANRQLMLNFNGKFAANGNNKRIKVWLNATLAGQTVTAGVVSGGTVSAVGSGVLLYDSGVLTTNAGGWQVDVLFCKFGATGSNTQYSQGNSIAGTIHQGTTAPLFPTQAESAAMTFVVTGSSPTTGAANDVVLQYTEINAMN